MNYNNNSVNIFKFFILYAFLLHKTKHLSDIDKINIMTHIFLLSKTFLSFIIKKRPPRKLFFKIMESAVIRPVPRPRRVVAEQKSKEEDCKSSYINVTIRPTEQQELENDSSNNDNQNLKLNITSDEVDLVKIKSVDSKNPYSELISEINSLSETEDKPKPAPRTKTLQRNLQQYENTIIKEKEKEIKISGGAIKKQPIRKAPELPSSSTINSPSPSRAAIMEPVIVLTEESDKKIQNQEIDIEEKLNRTASSNTLDSLTSSENSDKYRTSSPGDILRSIGASSRLLTESITERVHQKTKGAKKKILKTSKDTLSTLGTETTSRIKNVRNKIMPHLSLGRSNSKDPDLNGDRPVTVPANDSVFNSIQFNSPLNSKTKNCENLTDSTYEIPRKTKSISISNDSSQLSIECPSYEDALKNDGNSNISGTSFRPIDFERNTSVTQSMMSSVGERSKMKELSNPLPILIRNKSEPKLNEIDDTSSSPEARSGPCPNFPAPILDLTPIYGKINKQNFSSSDDDINISDQSTTRIPPPRHRKTKTESDNNFSNRATVDPGEYKRTDIYPKLDHMKILPERETEKVTSWSFYDEVAKELKHLEIKSEPVYVNSESVYGTVFDPNNPTPGTSKRCPDEIIKEFDPLFNEDSGNSAGISSKSNHLILLESLLSEETYGSIDDDNITDDQSGEVSDDDNLSIASESQPAPPARLESLKSVETRPENEDSKRKKAPKSMIIHQNMSLRSDSMENIVDIDEEEVNKYLTRTEPLPVPPVDFARPAPQTSFFYVDGSPGPSSPAPTTSNNNLNDTKKNTKTPALGPPPSYQDVLKEKAIQEANQVQEKALVKPDDSSPKTSMMSKFSNVINKSLLRKSSMRSVSKPEVMVVLEMIPRPNISEVPVNHEGHLVRLPTGVVEDILKELQLRHSIIKGQKFFTFVNSEHKNPKESFPIEHITTIQCIQNHKYSTAQTDIFCFEITVAVPKNSNTQPIASNPNVVLTSNNSGNSKSSKICHVYGCVKQSDRSVWMQKLVENMTDVFPKTATQDFKRMGWCYLKNSISATWSGAWILLQRRKLLFYNSTEQKLEVLDLRKARCIVLKESDDSIKNLHVEEGPMMMIDCPPFTLYTIMNCPRETKVWRHIIKDEAHNNGLSLKNQQLTKDNIPVLVDKCINFIYTHGSMSEGIYRKAGSESSVNKLLTAFAEDAFSVQLTRSEYSEHDIATALKRFMRDLPEPLLGKYTVSFLSVGNLKSTPDKLQSYKELLERLPTIEYQTLRKLLGHLNFIQSQRTKNKMGIENLAMLWGQTLMADKKAEQVKYSNEEASVMGDFIGYYKYLFHPTQEEVKKEEVMLAVLQKYHAAAENLSDTVKQSGDLKVWIQIELGSTDNSDDNLQVSVTLTPTKTVHDLCKDLKNKAKMEPYQLTLYEVILNGELERPMHYKENVLDTVLRWTAWPESDRKSNCLKLKQNKFMLDVERALKNLPSVHPTTELKFADYKSKILRTSILELINGKINVLKREKNSEIKNLKTIDVKQVIPFLGCEKKRHYKCRWVITLIEKDFKKRSRERPYIGHVLTGDNSNDKIIWYSCILHSLFGNDLMPTPEFL